MKYGINALLNMGFYDDPIRFMNTLDLDEAEGIISNIETLKRYFEYTFFGYTKASIDRLYDLSLVCKEGDEYPILLKNVKKLLNRYTVDIASSIIDTFAFVYPNESLEKYEESITTIADNMASILDTEDKEIFKELVMMNIRNNIIEEDVENIEILKRYFDYTFLNYTKTSIDRLYDLSLLCVEGDEDDEYQILLKNVKRLLNKYAADIASSLVDNFTFVYSDDSIRNHEYSIIEIANNLATVLDIEDKEIFKELVKMNIEDTIIKEDINDANKEDQ